ncbi:MAG: glycosyl transferase family 2, partial [Thermoprotei archaeon]
MITISVIIPTLNSEKTLPLLFNSLEKQVFKDFEVIVVDGFS